MAYIKQRKYKEALLDCEQALYINPKFAKAHMRAFQCNLNIGDLQKAKTAAEKAVELGDAATAPKVPFINELLKYEAFVSSAKGKKEWREAIFYLTKILEYATDSIRHVALKIECMICDTPCEMTTAIRYTT